MALLDDLMRAGQTPWAMAQQSDWQNPGSNMAQLPAQEIMKLLGMGGGQVQGGPQAPAPAAPQPVQRTPLPPPEMEPTASGIGKTFPQGGSGVLQQYGAGASYQPGAGSDVKVSEVARAPPAAAAPTPAQAPSPAVAPPVGVGAPMTAKRPDFSIQPQGSDYLGAVLKGAGGMLGPLGDLVGGQSGRARAAQSQNMTYDWLIRQGTDPKDAEFIVRNPDVMKAVVATKFGAAGTTDELKEYRFDVNQRMARGEKDIPTFGEWKANLRKAGSTQVTVDQRHESEFGKKLAAQEAERYGKLVNGGSLARDQIANLDVVGQAIDVYNQGSKLGTGALAPYESALRSYGAAVGIGNASTVGAAELVESITNRMALLMRNPDGGMGMPGALSDADRNFLKASQPGIDKSPAGNRRMIEILKRVEQRKIEVAEMAADWVGKNNTMKGFEQHLNQWAKANPLFSDFSNVPAQQRSGPDGAASFATPAVAGAMPRPRTPEEAAQLPKGTRFIDPDGAERVRP